MIDTEQLRTNMVQNNIDYIVVYVVYKLLRSKRKKNIVICGCCRCFLGKLILTKKYWNELLANFFWILQQKNIEAIKVLQNNVDYETNVLKILW